MNSIDFKEEQERKAKVQALDPYVDDWNTGDFSDMTDEQLFKINFSVLQGLHRNIIKLKKKLGWGVFIDDVGRLQIIMSLVKEMQKRFFGTEVIPVKK